MSEAHEVQHQGGGLQVSVNEPLAADAEKELNAKIDAIVRDAGEDPMLVSIHVRRELPPGEADETGIKATLQRLRGDPTHRYIWKETPPLSGQTPPPEADWVKQREHQLRTLGWEPLDGLDSTNRLAQSRRNEHAIAEYRRLHGDVAPGTHRLGGDGLPSAAVNTGSDRPASPAEVLSAARHVDRLDGRAAPVREPDADLGANTGDSIGRLAAARRKEK
jgi:hypothetical protein